MSEICGNEFSQCIFFKQSRVELEHADDRALRTASLALSALLPARAVRAGPRRVAAPRVPSPRLACPCICLAPSPRLACPCICVPLHLPSPRLERPSIQRGRKLTYRLCASRARRASRAPASARPCICCICLAASRVLRGTAAYALRCRGY
jgi:hypothetical protein